MPSRDFFEQQKQETLQRRQNPGLKLFTFDVETSPAPDSLERFEPVFEPKEEEQPRIPKNLKEPAKVAAAEAELPARIAEWERKRELSVNTAREEWFQEGALRAERGRILAIGWKTKGREVVIHHSAEDERAVIIQFLHNLSDAVAAGMTIAGFNIMGFDLPYIRRRCLILGIPFAHYDRNEKWKAWKMLTYDAMIDWQCGVYKDKYVSLDHLMRALNVGKKTESGENFAKLYLNPETRDIALKYLEGDVLGADGVCRKILGI